MSSTFHLYKSMVFTESIVLTGVFIQTEFSTQPPLLRPSHSLISLHTLTGQRDRKKHPVTPVGVHTRTGIRDGKKKNAVQQSEVSRVLRIKVVLKQTSARCLTNCMYRTERGGAADECRQEVRNKVRHAEVQRGKFPLPQDSSTTVNSFKRGEDCGGGVEYFQ